MRPMRWRGILLARRHTEQRPPTQLPPGRQSLLFLLRSALPDSQGDRILDSLNLSVILGTAENLPHTMGSGGSVDALRPTTAPLLLMT